MQAYKNALTDGTTSLGPPDSEFFRYFLGNSYNPEAPPAPTAGSGAATGGGTSGTTTSP